MKLPAFSSFLSDISGPKLLVLIPKCCPRKSTTPFAEFDVSCYARL